MTKYQIYLIEGVRLQVGEELQCETDAEAVDRFVAAHLRPCPAELWDKGRRVAELTPDGKLALGEIRPATKTN